jgi:hypothetical protein
MTPLYPSVCLIASALPCHAERRECQPSNIWINLAEQLMCYVVFFSSKFDYVPDLIPSSHTLRHNMVTLSIPHKRTGAGTLD